MRSFSTIASFVAAASLVPAGLACDSCYGPTNHVEHVRHVKRMQPGVANASYGPTRELEWGQLNFLHTTDTHGWLEGHLKEGNYGADWGDFVSFSTYMKQKASEMGVDLLLVDTGDLHDGNGLSDVTSPDAEITNPIFEKVDYDLLTIGNHELYLAEVAYQTFTELSKFWGDKYLTSNVQILNNATNEWEYIGQQYKYFTTAQGVRIMAFGVLFDFTGNVNISKVTPAKTLVTQDWFLDAVNYTEPVDLFLVLGHNPARVGEDTGSTFGVVHDAIRSVHANTPIQFFGGHSHIRDFAVLDASSTSIESGRYCETLGWVSMSGFSKCSSGWKGAKNPEGVPNPSKKAVTNSTSPYKYSRRYLDWNRATFDFHAVGGQSAATFDTALGLDTTSAITTYREQLNLGQIYGCAPQSYCMTCAEFNSTDNIFPLLSNALATAVVNETRQDIPRYIIANTGSIRFDLYKGPFTYDDFFIVSPFTDVFMYVPEVPCSLANTVLDGLNNAGANEKRNFGYMPIERDICVDPITAPLTARDVVDHAHLHTAVTRRQVVDLVAGYTTTDDFGTDGDDTAHSAIPYYSVPDFFQGEGGFSEEGCTGTADLIFLDFIQSDVLAILGSDYSDSDVGYYINSTFTTRDYLPLFVEQSDIFQSGMPNCTTSS
ncbi:putative Calcineurin-like phosphoesterase domain-containing protein [Seiridium cardinale]|uniref:Calcineurin-like phosphoesterase domain-containing protein n=1 Tax=Seiridium cardinale TaxID=138064 RepID=A0ABR2Y065_9PEZI